MNFDFEKPEVMYLDVLPELAEFPIPNEIKTGKWHKFDVKTLHYDVKQAVKAKDLTLTDVIALQNYIFTRIPLLAKPTKPADFLAVPLFGGVIIGKTGYDYLDFVANNTKGVGVSNGYDNFIKEPIIALNHDEKAIGQAYWFSQKHVDTDKRYIQNRYYVFFMPANK